MLELNLLENIPARERFHSAILTTYSFDIHHFERQVLRTLKTKGISNVSVFVDAHRLDDCLGISSAYIGSISSRFGLCPITSRGAFHPKICFLVGEEHLALLFGSGNITGAGHGQNHELFDLLYADTESQEQLPLILEAWQYMKGLADRTDSVVTQQLAWATEESRLLGDFQGERHTWNDLNDGIRAACLYPEGGTDIHDQLSQLLPMDQMQKVTVLSPYHDREGKLIQQWLDQMPQAEFEILLQAGQGTHPYAVPMSERVRFYDWHGTRRAQRLIKNYDRAVHAKVMVFSTGEREYCLLGSANLTHQACGSQGIRSVNDEFSLLLTASGTDYSKLLGLDGKRKRIELQDAGRSIPGAKGGQEILGLAITLTGADLSGRRLKISWTAELGGKKCVVGLFDFWGKELDALPMPEDGTAPLEISLPEQIDLASLAYVQCWDTKRSSATNKHPVIDVGQLSNNHPSRENRDYIKLIHRVESGTDGLTEVIEYFGHLWKDRIEQNERLALDASPKVLAVNEKEEGQGISHAQAKERMTVGMAVEGHHGNSREERLFEAIEKDIARRANELAEMVANEESSDNDGSQEVERESVSNNEPKQLNSRAVLVSRRRKIHGFMLNYLKMLEQQLEKVEEVGLRDLALGLVFTDRVLRLIKTRVAFKKEEGEEMLFPVRGSFAELDSTTGVALNVISLLIVRICEDEWQELEDDYLIERVKRYQLELKSRICLLLAHIVKCYSQEDTRLFDWNSLLFRDLFHRFGFGTEDMSEVRRYAGVYLTDESVEPEMTIIEAWTDMAQEGQSEDIFKLSRVGHCFIKKRIPTEGKSKFVRLERPGFPYRHEHHDFADPRLYSLESGEWMKTKQSLSNTR